MNKPEKCFWKCKKTVFSNGKAFISCCILSLPIQAVIQAAFFSWVLMMSTVACGCFITRQRLHIHIDICDRKGGITNLHLLMMTYDV